MSKQEEPVKTVPTQDDESDLDDILDGVCVYVLDDFNGVSIKDKDTTTKPPAATSEPKVTTKENQEEGSLDDVLDNEAFAKQLQEGMEEFMGNLDQDPEMKAAFEKVWSTFDPSLLAEEANKEAARSVPPTDAKSSSSSSSSAAKNPASFQDTINQTMNKLKDSSKQVDTAINEENDDAFMAELMKQMEGLTDGGDFENVLEGMMSQLMSKEMLYEPMKDLVEKYPAWLEENKDKTDKEQYENYKKQFELCKKIVAEYDAPGFDEKNEAQAKKIMDLMTEMQDLGQPPASLLEEMAPGMNFDAPQGMPDIKDLENCTIM
ncbi:Pex19 protein family-domain-containing protein [Cunninghamella echinulata]|nr:Pex19 protein family-domain-containing protein [Cunninghamella echinulata]